VSREIQKTEAGIQRDTRIQLAQLRKGILDSGLVHMYIQMGLTGQEHFIDTETNELCVAKGADSTLPQAERLKIMSTLVNKVLPMLKDTDEVEQDKTLLANLAKKESDNERKR